MSDDASNFSADPHQRLLEMLDSADSVDSLLSVLDEIKQSRDAIGVKDAAALARRALLDMSRLTTEVPDVAAEIISNHLLPWCLDVGSSAELAIERHHLLELLKEWLYAYSQTDMEIVRRRVLDDVRRRLERNPTPELLRVIVAIGYREPELEKFLWRVLENQGDLSDVVLGSLVCLGAAPNEHKRLFDATCERLATGRLTQGTIVTVQELVGPERMELAKDLVQLAVDRNPEEKPFNFALAVGAATRAVERCGSDTDIHEQVWGIIRNCREIVRMSSDFALRCDTRSTLIDHVTWLLHDDSKGDRDGVAYSMLSRLGEFSKPNQLAGWDELVNRDFERFLNAYATRDTARAGNIVTTRFRCKTEAWEAALTAGCPDWAEWVETAICDETNPYVVHAVADIVACLCIERLPPRICESIRESVPAQGDAGSLFRQIALVEIARASGSRDAFHALLHFGHLHEGHVLLSTVNAISDAVVERLDAGDDDVIEHLIRMTTAENPDHHREAAAAVFCRLCGQGVIRDSWLELLWTFALDDVWNERTRCEALEAIGRVSSEQTTARSDAIRGMALSDEGEIGWRACEVVIRRGWMNVSDEARLLWRLGINELNNQLRVPKPTETNGWQSYLIGLLFRVDKSRYCDATRDVVTNAPIHVIHQLLESLRHHGESCPNMVSKALADRICEVNGRAAAETELIDALVVIAPATLLELCEKRDVVDWMTEARTALCEAVREVAIRTGGHKRKAVECLARFMNDASFRVRRSAYRALSIADPDFLASICLAWSTTNNLELRKRATEALAWLPLAIFSDGDLTNFCLGWDREPSVRKLWNDVLTERRERAWAADYVERVLSSVLENQHATLKSYRYGRALARLGDDETVKQITSFCSAHKLKPNVAHWLDKIRREVGKHWKKRTEKWREPWSHERGSIELLDGEIVLDNGTSVSARFSLWCQHRSSPSDLSSWGGVAEVIDNKSDLLSVGRANIHIPGRASASVLVVGGEWGWRSPPKLVLLADGPYPALLAKTRDVQEGNLIEYILSNVGDVESGVTHNIANETSDRIQSLLDHFDISLVKVPAEHDAAVRTKMVCQEVALVIRTLADVIPPTSRATDALLRIAQFMFARRSHLLLVPENEREQFGELTQQGDLESPDELLFFLVDRVRSTESGRRMNWVKAEK